MRKYTRWLRIEELPSWLSKMGSTKGLESWSGISRFPPRLLNGGDTIEYYFCGKYFEYKVHEVSYASNEYFRRRR